MAVACFIHDAGTSIEAADRGGPAPSVHLTTARHPRGVWLLALDPRNGPLGLEPEPWVVFHAAQGV